MRVTRARSWPRTRRRVESTPTVCKARQPRKEMFVCSAGHTTERCEIRVLVPTKLRRVSTQHTIKYKNVTEFVDGEGYEIVEEKPYCLKHTKEVNPEVLVSHKVVKTTAHYNFNLKLRDY